MISDFRQALRVLTNTPGFSALVVIVLVVGIGALFVTRILDRLLFGVTAGDPATFARVSAMLMTALLVAAYLPARRATRVDPMVALRAE